MKRRAAELLHVPFEERVRGDLGPVDGQLGDSEVRGNARGPR